MTDGRTPWGQRMALRLAMHIPSPLLNNPERVFINAAAILLGLAALWPPPESVLDLWPDWLQYEWAVSMIIGGLAALHGTWTGFRPTERMGAGLFALCALMYAVGVIAHFGVMGIISATLFIALALAKTTRVIRSLAVSAEVQAAIRLRDHLEGELDDDR